MTFFNFKHEIANFILHYLKATETIYTRFLSLVKECIPQNIINAETENLRHCGLSYSKISFIKDLSLNVYDGILNIDELQILSDDELIKKLDDQKGIGKWTAEMIALFGLGRKNIFSFDDVALKQGIKTVHPEIDLTKQEFEKLRKLYAPICSVASVYYYHIHDYN